MQQKLLVFLSFFSMFILGFSQSAVAEYITIGQVIWVKGHVKAAMPNQTPRELNRRSPLYEHDIITTDNASTAEVSFADGAVVSLRAATIFKIDEYHFKSDDSSQNKSVMSIITGGFRTITGVIPKENPDSYQMNTPVATIGVRGTDFSIYYNPAKGGLSIKLDHGKILVRNANGTITLDQAAGEVYGKVASQDSAPTLSTQMPSAFSSATPITPVSSGSGSSQTVSSFCID